MPYEKNFCFHLPDELIISKTLKENPPRCFLPVMKPFETTALQADSAEILFQEHASPVFCFFFMQLNVNHALEIAATSRTAGFFYLMGIRGEASWSVAGHTNPFQCQRGKQCGLSAAPGSHILTLEPGVHQFFLIYTSSFLLSRIAAEWPEFESLGTALMDGCTPVECLPSTIYPQASYNVISRLTAGKEKHWSLHRVLENTIFTLIKNYAKQLCVLKEQAENGKPDLRARAMQYIRLHYTDPGLTKASVVKAMCVSDSTLENAFKSGFITIYNYIVKVRLLKASELLRLTDKSVGMIAQEVGFDDPNNFSKAFKKYFSLSPRAYRQRTQNRQISKFP